MLNHRKSLNGTELFRLHHRRLSPEFLQFFSFPLHHLENFICSRLAQRSRNGCKNWKMPPFITWDKCWRDHCVSVLVWVRKDIFMRAAKGWNTDQFQFDGKISECQTKISKIKSPNEFSLDKKNPSKSSFFRHRRCQALKSSQSAVLVFSYIARFESFLEHF